MVKSDCACPSFRALPAGFYARIPHSTLPFAGFAAVATWDALFHTLHQYKTTTYQNLMDYSLGMLSGGGQRQSEQPDPALVVALAGHKRLAQQTAELSLGWLEHILRQLSGASPASDSSGGGNGGDEEGSSGAGGGAAGGGLSWEDRHSFAFMVCSEAAILEAAAGAPGGRQRLGERLAALGRLAEPQQLASPRSGSLLAILSLLEAALKLGIDPMSGSRLSRAAAQPPAEHRLTRHAGRRLAATGCPGGAGASDAGSRSAARAPAQPHHH